MDVLRTVLDLFELLVFLLIIALGWISGRRIEREHLADLARREREVADVLVFATRNPPPSGTALDPVLLAGNAVIAADAFRMFAAGLRKMVGGRFHAFETLLMRARREAVLRVKEQARAAGCTMIFNLRVETIPILNAAHGGSSAVEALAYGTGFTPAQGSVAQALRPYVVGVSPPDEPAFDMAKEPFTRGVLIAMGIGTVFFFAELFGLQRYDYVGPAPWMALVAAGLAIAAAVLVTMVRRRLPVAETIALTFFSGLCATAVSYFVALHVNDWTDPGPVEATEYVRVEGITLKAPGKPDLEFEEHTYYWVEQPRGSKHYLFVRRGWLGFWQVDVRDERAQVRESFAAKRKRNQAAAGKDPREAE